MIKHYISANGEVQHWRCEFVNKLKCPARGESVAGTTAVVMRQKYARHNHEPDATARKVRKIQNEVKDQAKRLDMATAATIVDHALRGADDDVVLALPRDNLLRLVSNARQVAGARQVNRPALGAIVFPDAFKTTAMGDAFLLVDSRVDQPAQSVFFIFASPVQLREIRQRQHWAVDGTFYCTPSHFDSVFTIHVHIGHSSVPVAYFLLQDRTEATYRRALTAFVDAADLRFVQPASIMSDFELAAINALRATFPGAAIRLCLFHLAQSAFKNVAELGLVRLYRDNAVAQELLRCFPALAALPPEDVLDGLDVIVAELHRMLDAGVIEREWEHAIAEFEDYFEKTYIRALNRVGNGYVEPRYPVALWNHYHSIIGNLHRTNNAVEGKLPNVRYANKDTVVGWHHAFNNTFSAPHMALDKFIYRLKNDEDITRQRLLRNEVHAAEPLRRRRQKRYLTADKHLLALAQRYAAHYRENNDILRYLRCVQHHLQKPRFPGEAADVNEDPLEDVVDDEDGGDGDGEGAAPGQNDGRIPRRESHPRGLLHGFEPEGEDDEEHDGGLVVLAAAAAAAAVLPAVNGVDEPLPAFSQADDAENRPPTVHWGPPQLPSQSSSAATASAFVRRPVPAASGSHRGPGRRAVFNALSGNGSA
ncbi:hypothetical protein AAVH_32347 [Aphelenchoides avenae]|nr:hypothetical protein AAVH_32347 [Aphelenchus avenae]